MSEQFAQEEPINGAFIKAHKIKRDKLSGEVFSIKLSAIVTIQGIEGGSVIWTYKDCSYYVEVSEQELRDAINSFLFDSENHYANYI